MDRALYRTYRTQRVIREIHDMGEAAWAPDLTALADRYEVLGELRGTDELHSYLGRRIADRTDVTILVARAPRGGGNNALTHFAADTQLLSNISHPGMPRVLEGRWLGADSVAVVSERVRGSTLATLTSGDEPMSFPRVAAVLQQVNGVLDWARAHGIVHRGVSLESIAVEDGSGRVLVSLLPTPIPLEGVPDACADARALGALAFELLMGEPYAGGDPVAEMKELRPQLAQRVRDEVRAMLQCQTSAVKGAPDVHTFIAMIATADEMRLGEEERARLEAELIQKHKLECDRWEEQRKDLEDRIAADERRLKEQQSALDTAESEHRERLAAELAALETQRQQANERTRVAEEHATRAEARTRELEERARMLEERARALDAREAGLEQKYAAVMPTIEKPAARVRGRTPVSAPVVAPVVAPAATPVAAPAPAPEAARVAAPVVASTVVPGVEPAEPADWDASDEQPHRRSWTLPASAVALVLLIVLGIALAHRRSPARVNAIHLGRTTVIPAAAPLPATSPTAATSIMDSSAGSVAPAAPAPADSARGIARTNGATATDSSRKSGGLDSAAEARAAAEALARRARQASQAAPAPVYGPPAPITPPADSMVLVPLPSPSPVPRPADSTHPRRDSVSRDTTSRRDTTRRDTTHAGVPAVDSTGH